MATNKVTTSFTVSFSTSDSDEGILVAEVDDRDPEDGGLNEDTSFKPGEDVVYLVYAGPGVTVVGQYHSWGSHVGGGLHTVTQEEDVTFMSPDSLEQSLKYPVNDLVSLEALGNAYPGGAPVLVGNSLVVKKTADTYGVGVYRVTYTSTGRAYTLKHAPLGVSEYEIATQVVGTYKKPT